MWGLKWDCTLGFNYYSHLHHLPTQDVRSAHHHLDGSLTYGQLLGGSRSHTHGKEKRGRTSEGGDEALWIQCQKERRARANKGGMMVNVFYAAFVAEWMTQRNHDKRKGLGSLICGLWWGQLHSAPSEFLSQTFSLKAFTFYSFQTKQFWVWWLFIRHKGFLNHNYCLAFYYPKTIPIIMIIIIIKKSFELLTVLSLLLP